MVLTGCVEVIPLGSECPPDRAFCDDTFPDTRPVGPMQPFLDAGLGSPETPMIGDALTGSEGNRIDAGLGAAVDAAIDGGTWPMPALLNWSFELTSGQAGDITTVSLPSFTSISPWHTCQAIGGGTTPLTAVRAERTLSERAPDGGVEIIRPTEGDTFIAIRYFVNILQLPLVQRLGTPMRAGTPYAFSVDVRSTSPSARLSLQVRGDNDECIGLSAQEALAETPPIAPGAWRRLCVAFTPQRDHSVLLLQVTSNPQLSDDLLLVDNIREATDCADLR